MKLDLNVLLAKLDSRSSIDEPVFISGIKLLVKPGSNKRFNTFLLMRKEGIKLECVCCKAKPSYAEYTTEYGLRMMISSNNNLTIDHIIPKAKGGKNDKTNYQIMCRICNNRKGSRI